jgi:anthranilate synthase component 1
MFLLQTPDTHLAGSSPEIMVRVDQGQTTIRPLAGTRPRGKTPAEDKALEAELLADPKERAEHVMLIDLARTISDAWPNMAPSNSPMSWSSNATVTSCTSPQMSPACSVPNSPPSKPSAPDSRPAPSPRPQSSSDGDHRRNRTPQTRPLRRRAVGYFDFCGNMDTCIALRTLVIRNGRIDIQAGAGIVADSVPQMEYRETLNKARALLKAIHIAETQLSPQSSE